MDIVIRNLYVFLQHENLGELKNSLKETQLEDSKKRELSTVLHASFKDWLYGNSRSSMVG